MSTAALAVSAVTCAKCGIPIREGENRRTGAPMRIHCHVNTWEWQPAPDGGETGWFQHSLAAIGYARSGEPDIAAYTAENPVPWWPHMGWLEFIRLPLPAWAHAHAGGVVTRWAIS
jgi:hypothetical protein